MMTQTHMGKDIHGPTTNTLKKHLLYNHKFNQLFFTKSQTLFFVINFCLS